MPYPETRPDGSPLATELTPQILHWFCRSGIEYATAIAHGVVTPAAVLALWNVRDDRSVQLQCNKPQN